MRLMPRKGAKASKEEFKNPLPGVPNVESPFFEEIFGAMDLDRETMRVARDLKKNGFAVFDFPEPEFAEFSKHIIQELDSRYDWDGWGSGKLDSLRIQDAWQFNSSVQRIAANPRVLELLGLLYGRRAIPFQTLNFPVGTQQAIHLDLVHFSSVPERYMCGVWVAFEDTDQENGPLFYYPESHSLPAYVNEHTGTRGGPPENPFGHYPGYLSLWKNLTEVRGLKKKHFLAKKGQALIWAANLLHGGEVQKDLKRTRYSQVTHYYFENCCYYPPLNADPFLGRISFREITDIATGEKVPNRYGSEEVPASFIEATRPT